MYKNQPVAPTQLSEWRPAFRIEDWIEQWEVLNFPRQCVHNHTNFQLGSLAADIVFYTGNGTDTSHPVGRKCCAGGHGSTQTSHIG